MLYFKSTPCPEKGATKLMAVTSSNLKQFSKFFYSLERELNFQQNSHITSHHALSIREIMHGLYRKINSLSSDEKNENQLRFDDVTTMSLLALFCNMVYI